MATMKEYNLRQSETKHHDKYKDEDMTPEWRQKVQEMKHNFGFITNYVQKVMSK